MRAIVLAAGLGKRLRPLTYEMPKPLMPVVNRPVMEHIIRLLARQGFSELVTNTSHLPEMLQEQFGDGSSLGVDLVYSYEEELLGTAGGVRNVAEFLTGGDADSFLVISGDGLTDLDLRAMAEFHEDRRGIATIALKQVPDPSEYGVVITGDDGRIQAFQEKPDPGEALSDLASSGIYMFRNEIFDHFPDTDFVDWAMDVFPALLEGDVPMYGYEITGYWNDVGSVAEYLQGNADALAGSVDVEVPGQEIADGVLAAPSVDLADDVTFTGRVLIGEGTRVDAGATLEGPLVIGGGCEIAENAWVKASVLLDGARVAPRSMLIRGIAGPRTRLA
ncbi:MAG: sugar phosphate nucleotidyltransferase [Solirubrobacterales bacterium]